MKRFIILLLVFLISLNSGCSLNGEPSELTSRTELTETTAESLEPPHSTEPPITSTVDETRIISEVSRPPLTEQSTTGTSEPPKTEVTKTQTTTNTETAVTSVTETDVKSADYDFSEILKENRELLLKYTDTPSNFAITLLGLDGLVNDIREAGGTGLDLTDKCIELTNMLKDTKIYDDLLDFNARFLDCNAKTLEVKENRDIDSLEPTLNNTLLTIKEYNVFLEEISEKTGG